MRVFQKLLACTAVLVIACAMTSAPAVAREVKAAIQFGLAYLPMIVVEEDKLLDAKANKRGLDGAKLTLIRLSGSTAINDALLSGNADMGVMGMPSLLILWEKTKGAYKGLAGMSSFPMVLNTISPDIRSLSDFAAKDRIALPATTSPQAMVLRIAAEKHFGATEYKRLDANMVSMPHPEALAALLAGTEVTAHFTNLPFSAVEAQDKRMKRLLNSHDVLGVRATFVLLVASTKSMATDPKIGDAMVAALEEGMRRIIAEPRRAAELYLKNEPSKMTVEFVESLIKDPENAFSIEPAGIMAYAQAMNRWGQLKSAPKDWKEVIFAPLHGRSGS
jgi:NitT/TauT family transport system substrate-binding protein